MTADAFASSNTAYGDRVEGGNNRQGSLPKMNSRHRPGDPAAVDTLRKITANQARRTHSDANEVSINESSFQPPQITKVMTVRTKTLAVHSSRFGCATGAKSKPPSDSLTSLGILTE